MRITVMTLAIGCCAALMAGPALAVVHPPAWTGKAVAGATGARSAPARAALPAVPVLSRAVQTATQPARQAALQRFAFPARLHGSGIRPHGVPTRASASVVCAPGPDGCVILHGARFCGPAALRVCGRG